MPTAQRVVRLAPVQRRSCQPRSIYSWPRGGAERAGLRNPSEPRRVCGILLDVSNGGTGERAGEAVVIWVPVWQRVWLPLVIGALLLVNAVMQVADRRAPLALFGAVAMALAFWNWRVPILFADAAGLKLGRRRFVPWSDVAELRSRPDHARKRPVELVMLDGTRRTLLSDLDLIDGRRLEHLFAASRSDGPPQG